ncbi:hypothetical protein ACMXYX_15275 [Neptuniibacter sp. QD72_48]|uniref:hypothetical protein n=1 Tax=unclassified Neptuniibacter TaxID=2630693 RepID=UPI0039F4901A
MTNNAKSKPNFRRNLTLSLGIVLLVGFIVSILYMHLATSRQAIHETQIIGQNIAKQSELLIRPLLLSDDRVSLNYLLSELTQLEYVGGLHVQDANGFTLARAGKSSQQTLQQQLIQQEKTIGTVTIWLDSGPVEQLLRSQLWPLLIIAIFTAILLLTTSWFFTRSDKFISESSADEEEKFEPSFSDTLATQTPAESTPQEITEDTVTIGSATAEIGNSETQEQLAVESTQTSSEAAPVIRPSAEAENLIQDNTETGPDAAPKAISEPQAPNQKASDLLHTHELVDLLKPAPSTQQQMPKFEHQPQQLDETVANTVETLVLEEEPVNAQETHTPMRENPLLKSMSERHEEQLDLYSFEQELELILTPQDAIYLFYIDANTASSDNMEPDEKATLLNVYHHLAKQVARIYNGACEQLPNKDILLRFELRDEKDSHGINALCAGQLFNLLYKGFNHSRIRGFQPVLSLQMSLARGHHDKHDLVKEEAHFLTRTTNSNDLISHTALTEAPLLKEAMLQEADIRREDEDKVLLLKVTPKHQTLLQKQANHLLTKIFKKS